MPAKQDWSKEDFQQLLKQFGKHLVCLAGSYLKHWLDGMANDSKFIFKAAAQASKAVDFLLSFSRTTATTSEPVEELVLA